MLSQPASVARVLDGQKPASLPNPKNHLKPMRKTLTNRALASCLGMILIACSTQQTVQADSLIWGGQSSYRELERSA